MKLAVIDATDWQVTVDLERGREVQPEHPLLPVLASLLKAHPFPGDLDASSARWVTDVALDVVDGYRPSFMMLIYATPYLVSAFTPTDTAQRAAVVDQVFAEIGRFLVQTDFTPVIVGLGGMVPLRGQVDLTGLEGLAVAGGMPAQYAGLFRPAPRDLAFLRRLPGVARIVDRVSFQKEFGGNLLFYRRFPDYLLVAEEGYVLRGLGSSARPIYLVPKYEREIPLHCPVPLASQGLADLTSVAGAVSGMLAGSTKVALILVEGVGCATFPLPFHRITNTCRWYCYTVGDNQYLAITTGRHLVENGYPPGFPYYAEDDEEKPFPFSGVFREMPQATIAQQHRYRGGRTAAVGNRSILTHATSGCEVAVECFARALYNHGAMAVLDLEALPGAAGSETQNPGLAGCR
ncbi:MAG: hypothetical protein QHH27_04670 [Clostridia bacterium]|jgi:hypothetical protein|nr:hypothetical protein [Clostridia bacterium]MDH7572828.1 hypothetical protein [Clostridia bacterium]